MGLFSGVLLEDFYGKGGPGEVGERIGYGKKRVEGGSSKNGGRGNGRGIQCIHRIRDERK